MGYAGPMVLYVCDIDSIVIGEKLSDLYINLAQRLPKQHFPWLHGLQSTLLQSKKHVSIGKHIKDHLQAFNCGFSEAEGRQRRSAVAIATSAAILLITFTGQAKYSICSESLLETWSRIHVQPPCKVLQTRSPHHFLNVMWPTHLIIYIFITAYFS